MGQGPGPGGEQRGLGTGGRQYDSSGQGEYERPVSCPGGDAQEAVEDAIWRALGASGHW